MFRLVNYVKMIRMEMESRMIQTFVLRDQISVEWTTSETLKQWIFVKRIK